jgi:hypothetical protein
MLSERKDKHGYINIRRGQEFFCPSFYDIFYNRHGKKNQTQNYSHSWSNVQEKVTLLLRCKKFQQ